MLDCDAYKCNAIHDGAAIRVDSFCPYAYVCDFIHDLHYVGQLSSSGEIMKSIGFNIWDDFHDDGYVPVGKKQCTFGYVEEDLSDDDKDEICKLVYAYILTLDMTGVKVECNDRMYFTDLTHARLEKLITELDESALHYQNRPISFYSES
jgi:hypothetical protein